MEKPLYLILLTVLLLLAAFDLAILLLVNNLPVGLQVLAALSGVVVLFVFFVTLRRYRQLFE